MNMTSVLLLIANYKDFWGFQFCYIAPLTFHNYESSIFHARGYKLCCGNIKQMKHRDHSLCSNLVFLTLIFPNRYF